MASVSSGEVHEISADGNALAPELHLAVGGVLGAGKSAGTSSEVEMHFPKQILWLSRIRIGFFFLTIVLQITGFACNIS